MEHETNTFAIRFTSRTILRLGLLAFCAIVLWFAFDILLVIFAGALAGVLLRTAVDWVRQKTGWGPRASYLLVTGGILALIAGVVFGLGPRVITEAGDIAQIIPKSIEQIKTELYRHEWGRYLVSFVSRGAGGIAGTAGVSRWIKNISNQGALLLVAIVLGFFFAWSPSTYISGAKGITPEAGRPRLDVLCSEIAYTLRWWLVGQLVPMCVLGVGAFFGLWILGVPLPFTLALFTAVMLFVPYVGSLISLIPAALVGLLKGPQVMLWVIVIYLCVHALEGYLVTPLSQKRAIRLPPALTITSQLLMWKAAGLLGLVVATPLAAAIVATVQLLYCHQRPSLRRHEQGTLMET